MLGLPGYDPRRDAAGCIWDPIAAKRILDFFEHPEDGCLRHVKGERSGQRFVLEPWERSILANIFAWKRADGTRRYREIFIYLPRKNGKTAFTAGMALYVLTCDDEGGAEIYSAASDKDQAALIFEHAAGMVRQDEALAKRLQVFGDSGGGQRKSIVFQERFSAYKVISSESNTKHGFNTHMAIIDELHAQPDRDLVDVLTTSTGSRKQPLIVTVTTADFLRESICNEKYDYACKVRDGILQDPAFMPVIYEAPVGSDWTSPAVWKVANPNLGISLSEEYFTRECRRAQEIPSYENTFKRLHLNIRTQNDIRWLSAEAWDKCPGTLPDLAGMECWAGLDLATTTDIAAFVLFFPEGNCLLPYFWVPMLNAEKRERRDRVPYQTWIRQGILKGTPGNVIDYDCIRADIGQIGKLYNVREIAVDRWNSTQLQTQLAGDGFTVVPFGQGFASMSGPTKEFEKLVTAAALAHGGNPILKWMASNVTVETDAAGNLKPSKARSTEKIDGIVAGIMAIGRALVRDVNSGSVYETRGLEVLG